MSFFVKYCSKLGQPGICKGKKFKAKMFAVFLLTYIQFGRLCFSYFIYTRILHN